MLNRMSFRSRLTCWYLVSLLFILIVFGVAIQTMIRSHLYSQQDAELSEEGRELAEELLNAPSDFQQNFNRHFSEHGRFSFQVEHPDGTVLCGSPWLRAHSLPRFDWANPVSTVIDDVPFGRLGRHRILSRLIRTNSGTLLIRVVAANSEVERNAQAFRRILMLAGLLALLTACLGGAMITRQAMQPLERIIRDAERISAENCNKLVTVENPHDELGRLSLTLNRTFSRLQRSIQQMSRFTADAAHELRTPLAALRLECDVALTGEQDLASTQRSISRALEEIDRLTHIVNQLLALSRMDAGVELQSMDSVFLRELIQDVAELLDKSARSKGVQLSVEEIPQCLVQGDDVALSRLFFNLIDNSIKYTPSGGQVVIRGTESNGQVTVSICDTGIGIEHAHWEHLFDRFYRVDASRNSDTGGAGLGLSICKAIADAHHATLKVDSVAGQGSTFSVTFPAIPASVHQERHDSRELHDVHAV